MQGLFSNALHGDAGALTGVAALVSIDRIDGDAAGAAADQAALATLLFATSC
ncbi:MAG TPA: hypothetical protein VK614_15365 [Allosphingosinicella sp.]|nr:hypothetical protein [Allosphingosinicella sp.]